MDVLAETYFIGQEPEGWTERLGSELTRGFAGELADRISSRLGERMNLDKADREDLAQDLRLKLLRAAHKFHPDRGNWYAFVTKALQNAVRNWIHKYWRTLHPASLEQFTGDDQATLGQDVSLDTPTHLTLQRRRTAQDQSDLEQDVEIVISSLDPEDQVICLGLMTTTSVAELARLLKMPRRTLRDRITKLRPVFASYQMEKYLLDRPPLRLCQR